VEAQNSAERKKSKKDGQYPAPPARSKASRLGIAKKLIDFLLEHDVSSLRSSTHASHWKDVGMMPSLQRNEVKRDRLDTPSGRSHALGG
jgi:hypothetical protein